VGKKAKDESVRRGEMKETGNRKGQRI
jgi:hypothetical protein